jgi:hypothetical protein
MSLYTEDEARTKVAHAGLWAAAAMHSPIRVNPSAARHPLGHDVLQSIRPVAAELVKSF